MTRVYNLKKTREDVENAISALYDGGYSAAEVGIKLNLSEVTVRWYLRKLGIPVDENKWKPTGKQYKRYCEEWNEAVEPIRFYYEWYETVTPLRKVFRR